MNIDLVQLLQVREIVHPARVLGMKLDDNTTTVHVRGYPWWSEELDKSNDHDISFVFYGVSGGLIDPSDFYSKTHEQTDWDLEELKITPTAEIPYLKGATVSIYCGASISMPLKIYSIVDDYLYGLVTTPRATNYLNQAHTITQFIEHVANTGFLLGSFPASLGDLLSAELKKQSVSHSILPEINETVGKLLVCLESS